MAVTAGYDVGGAHLKVALAEDGRIVAVEQVACPLWEGLDRLDAAFEQVAPLTARADRHAATMTGELCELFPDRSTGVLTLIDRLVATLGPDVHIWMGKLGFGFAEAARANSEAVASTNFLATADLVARRIGDGLLVDMGSTTTDIIPIVSGRPACQGLADGDRLATSELVYTGLTRTDVSAVSRSASLRGRKQRLAGGGFATMADVRRVLGELTDGLDQHETADRRGKSLKESVARLARCFGRDGGDASLDDWREAARTIADNQLSEIRLACAHVLAVTPVAGDAPVIAAGVGAETVRALAAALGRPCRFFGDLIEAADDCRAWATRCAPVAAVALLADSPQGVIPAP